MFFVHGYVNSVFSWVGGASLNVRARIYSSRGRRKGPAGFQDRSLFRA